MSVRTSLHAWALALLCLGSTGAHAQSQPVAPEPVALDGVDYDTAVSRALSANAERDFATARRYMEHAHALEPSARTLRGLGIIAYGEGDARTALRYFEAALAEQTKPLPEGLRASVAKLLVEVYARVGRYSVHVPEDAILTVDGRPAERDAQGRVLLSPGSHSLAIQQGSTVRSLRVVTSGGELMPLTFPEAAPGAQELDSPPEQARGARAPHAAPVRDGDPPGRARNPLAIGLASGAGALMLAGGALGLTARMRFDDATMACEKLPGGGCDSEARNREWDRRNIGTFIWTGVGAAAAGGAMAVVAGVLWWKGVGKKHPSRPTVTASPDPRSPTLHLTVSF